MLVKLLGLIDIFASLSLALLTFGIGKTFAIIMLSIVLLRSFVFIKDIVSIIDLVAVSFFVISIFGLASGFNWLAVIWLAQKGIFSLLA